MNENDKSLILQMMQAGKYGAVLDFMPAYNLDKSREVIEKMGDKWCCHPSNRVKKLDVPLDILDRKSTRLNSSHT